MDLFLVQLCFLKIILANLTQKAQPEVAFFLLSFWIQRLGRDTLKHDRPIALTHYLCNFGQDLTLEGARGGPWDHTGAPLGPEPNKRQRIVFCVLSRV